MVKGILKEITLILIIFCFTYIFNCTSSFILLYVVLMSAIVDIISIISIKNKIYISMDSNTNYVDNRQKFVVKFNIRNRSFLPISRVELFLFYDGFKNISSEGIFFDSIDKENEIFITLEAMHVGKGSIGIERYEVHSIFGTIKRRIKCNNSFEVVVKPRVLDVNDISNKISWTMDNSRKPEEIYLDKDSVCLDILEDEYRSYMQGEKLSRVNWKLYSKTHELYTRKPSQYGSRSNVIVVLEPFLAKKSQETDDCLETFISIINECYIKGIATKCILCYGFKIRAFDINSVQSVNEIKNHLSFYDGNENTVNVINNFKIEREYSYILVTANDLKDNEFNNLYDNIVSIYTNYRNDYKYLSEKRSILVSRIRENKCIIEGYKNV